MRSVLPGANYSRPSQWSSLTIISNQQSFHERGTSFKISFSFKSRLYLVQLIDLQSRLCTVIVQYLRSIRRQQIFLFLLRLPTYTNDIRNLNLSLKISFSSQPCFADLSLVVMDAEVHDVVTVRSGSKPRRPHKKAKTGCLDCRRRRVKVRPCVA